MKEVQIIIFIVIILFSCKAEKIEYNLISVFPNTIKHQIEDKGKYVAVSIEDKYYTIDKDYMDIKASLIAYQILKNNPKVESLKITIEKDNRSQYNQTFKKEIIQKYFDMFNNNETYLEICKILFKDFDDSEFWNWRGSIHELSKAKSNKEKGCKELVELLFDYSKECGKEINDDIVRASDFLKEGIRLINSAGMNNFFNQEEIINQEELINHANEIFALCNLSPMTKSDTIIIKDRRHIIQKENKN